MALAAGASIAGSALAQPAHAKTVRTADSPPDEHQPAETSPLILTNATVLDPLTGEVTENAVLVFARGRVLLSGAGIPERRYSRYLERGGRLVDLEGRWVVPGLLDAHVHVSTLDNATRALAGGATTLRSASTSFFEDVGIRALARYQPNVVPDMVPAGVFVTPHLGDSILADPDLASLSTLPDGVRELEDLAHLTQVNAERGVGAIKTRATERAGLPEQDPREQVYSHDQLRQVVETAHEADLPVQCHSHGAEGCHDAVRAGVDSLEHGTWVEEHTLDLMADQGTAFTPTFSAVADLAEPGGEYTDPDLVERGREMYPVLAAATAEAHQRGVSIVAGTDTQYSTDTLSSIGGEIEHIHGAGVPALDAIRAATTNAAALLGFEGKRGRLNRGYRADAVVVDNDPLSDISELQRIRMVVGHGAVARDELDT